MEYTSSKDKLPKGLSYPLKKSLLDPALEAVGLQQLRSVSYLRKAWRTEPGKLVLRAVYCGESNRGWFAAGTSSVYVFSVPSPSRKLIEGLLVAEALPLVASWLHDLEDAGNTRRGDSHQFEVKYVDGKLALSPQ
jgi:hypothetical protein